MLTCLRSGAPSLSILGKDTLFLAKFMQPANFFFGTFFFFREKKKALGGPGGNTPPKRRGPGKAFPKKLLKPEESLTFFLHHHPHAGEGITFLQGDDILIIETDAALAGTAGNGVLIVGTAVNANAGKARRP